MHVPAPQSPPAQAAPAAQGVWRQGEGPAPTTAGGDVEASAAAIDPFEHLLGERIDLRADGALHDVDHGLRDDAAAADGHGIGDCGRVDADHGDRERLTAEADVAVFGRLAIALNLDGYVDPNRHAARRAELDE